MLIEFIKLIICSLVIVLISKYILAKNLRILADVMNLKPKTVGNISGMATSIPELLTTTISALKGLHETSVINILSSNVINTILYIMSIFFNNNQRKLKDKLIILELVLVFFTIFIPVIFSVLKISLSIYYVPVFIILYIVFKMIDNLAHKYFNLIFFEKSNMEMNLKRQKKIEVRKVVKSIVFILLAGVLLFVIGNIFSGSLETLCNKFNVSQIVIGIFLGFVTSMPEFITFFEAQKKQKTSIEGVTEATNNLLSSNMVNLFVVQSVGLLTLFIVTSG